MRVLLSHSLDSNTLAHVFASINHCAIRAGTQDIVLVDLVDLLGLNLVLVGVVILLDILIINGIDI
jgi:hypothetical protein